MLTTKDGKTIKIEALRRDSAIELLKPINSKLADLIDKFSSNDSEYLFYKATYSFGEKIFDKRKCYLSLSDGSSINLNDTNLPDSLLNDLSYDPSREDPLAIVLSKNSELYLSANGRVIPHSIVRPGRMFGIPRGIFSTPAASALIWNLNAGARSIFLLSKVASKIKHSKLQRTYGLEVPAPQLAGEQYPIFKEIARLAKSSWQSEMLFFSRKWINKLKDPEWAEMSNYMNQLHRESYTIWHNMGLVWNSAFSDIEQQKNMTFSPYVLSNAKQLFIISSDSAPAFRPATNDDLAPIDLLQEAYKTGYGLLDDGHSLIIMEPTTFNHKDPVFYSLNHPILAQNNPETFKGKSLLSLLDEVRRATEIYQKNILLMKNEVETLYDVANTTKFDYYHSNTSQDYKNILIDTIIAEEDKRFVKDGCGEFASGSWFFSGCIKISNKG